MGGSSSLLPHGGSVCGSRSRLDAHKFHRQHQRRAAPMDMGQAQVMGDAGKGADVGTKEGEGTVSAMEVEAGGTKPTVAAPAEDTTDPATGTKDGGTYVMGPELLAAEFGMVARAGDTTGGGTTASGEEQKAGPERGAIHKLIQACV